MGFLIIQIVTKRRVEHRGAECQQHRDGEGGPRGDEQGTTRPGLTWPCFSGTL